MLKITRHILTTLSLLILSGIVLHGAVPHHHHYHKDEAHVCCNTHEHEGEAHDDAQPCNLLSSIYMENLKPEIQVFSKHLNINQIVSFSISPSENSYILRETISYPAFVHIEKLHGIILTHSLPHRAPPKIGK